MKIESFADVNLATMQVFASDRAGLGEDTQKHFDRVVTSPIAPEVAAHFGEVIYAHQEGFSNDSKALAADVCDWATSQGFYGLRENNRGQLIASVLRGENVPEAQRPVPLQQFSVTNPAPLGPTPAPL